MHSNTDSSRDRHCDVLIVGGGMAGASLALALGRHAPELTVAVVESAPIRTDVAPDKAWQPSYDARATALAYGSRLIYEDLGLWDAIAPSATPIRHIHVSDRGRFGSTRLHASDHGQPALGYVVDNAWLGLNLVSALNDSSVHWLCPAHVQSADASMQGARVVLERDGVTEHWHCELLVVADGGRSGLRESLGFRAHEYDYHQHALVATVTTARPHEGMAYERFTEQGPVALLPHGNGRDFALVWTLSDEALSARMALDDRRFLADLQQVFGWRQGRFERVGTRHSYPLKLQRVAEPARPGAVLVGNAAHALHPVAGQGFNLALRGLMRLSSCLGQARSQGQSPGDLAVLRPYLAEHRQDEDAIVGFSDGMVRLFSGENSGAAVLRDLGLMALDAAPAAKQWFSRQTMGMTGRRSSLGHD